MQQSRLLSACTVNRNAAARCRLRRGVRSRQRNGRGGRSGRRNRLGGLRNSPTEPSNQKREREAIPTLFFGCIEQVTFCLGLLSFALSIRFVILKFIQDAPCCLLA